MPAFTKIKLSKVHVRPLSSREGVILAVCLVMGFTYFSYRFVFQAMRDRLEEAQNKITVSQKRLNNDLKILRQEAAVEKEYEKYLEDVRQDATEEQEMASMLSEIESVANTIGLHVSDMKPKRVRRVDFYNQFSAALTIEGELSSILEFLYVLQGAPHSFKVDELYLERGIARSAQIKSRISLSKILIP